MTPTSRRRWSWVVGIAAFVLALCIGGAVAVWQVAQQRALPPLQTETTAQKYAEASAAYTHPDAESDPGLRRIHEFFIRLGKARASGDATAIMDCYDLDRQIAEAERLGYFKLTPRDRPGFMTGFRRGYSGKVAQLGTSMAWRRFDFCHVRFLPGGREAVVYVRELRKSGYEVKFRYWVRREGSTWRIYDAEELLSGVRETTQVGKAVADTIAAGGRTPSWIATHQAIDLAFTRISEGNLDSADRALKSVENVSMPPQVDVQRRIALATLHVRRRAYQDALSDLAPIDTSRTDAPLVDELRATALNGLHRPEEALASIQKYLDKLGDGGPIEVEKGEALAALKRDTDAAAAYRRGLAIEPDSAEDLEGLRRVLPPGQKAEIGQRLARSPDPKSAFHRVAREATIAGDMETLQTVVDGYASHGEDPLLAYYQATLLGHNKQYRQAADLYLATYPRSAAIDRPAVGRQFVLNMLNLGEPLDAYSRAPEPEPAFRKAAGWLLAKHDSATLVKLLDRRRADAPADAWVPYYQASLLQESKQYAAAAGTFFSAMDAASNRPDKATFRIAAVRASYMAGEGLEVFGRLRTKEVFSELAGYYSSARNAAGLESLLQAEGNRTGREPLDVAYWNAKLAYLQDKFQTAVEILSAAYPESDRMPGKDFRESDLLIRSLTRAGQRDAAMEQARRWSKTGQASQWYVAMIEANRGNVERATAAIDAFLNGDEEYTAADLYRDPDFRAALNSPAFAPWRETHFAANRSSAASRPASASGS